MNDLIASVTGGGDAEALSLSWRITPCFHKLHLQNQTSLFTPACPLLEIQAVGKPSLCGTPRPFPARPMVSSLGPVSADGNIGQEQRDFIKPIS